MSVFRKPSMTVQTKTISKTLNFEPSENTFETVAKAKVNAARLAKKTRLQLAKKHRETEEHVSADVARSLFDALAKARETIERRLHRETEEHISADVARTLNDVLKRAIVQIQYNKCT